jgi:hypothetical protein
MKKWQRIYLLTVALALVGSIAFGWQLAKKGSGNSPVGSALVRPI